MQLYIFHTLSTSGHNYKIILANKIPQPSETVSPELKRRKHEGLVPKVKVRVVTAAGPSRRGP
jgi:hypothetical protein